MSTLEAVSAAWPALIAIGGISAVLVAVIVPVWLASAKMSRIEQGIGSLRGDHEKMAGDLHDAAESRARIYDKINSLDTRVSRIEGRMADGGKS